MGAGQGDPGLEEGPQGWALGPLQPAARIRGESRCLGGSPRLRLLTGAAGALPLSLVTCLRPPFLLLLPISTPPHSVSGSRASWGSSTPPWRTWCAWGTTTSGPSTVSACCGAPQHPARPAPPCRHLCPPVSLHPHQTLPYIHPLTCAHSYPPPSPSALWPETLTPTPLGPLPPGQACNRTHVPVTLVLSGNPLLPQASQHPQPYIPLLVHT